jgi:O-antigen/teichoic acid export membrane protein
MLSRVKITLKDTLIYSLGNFSTKIVGLILIPLYTSELSVEEYGILSILEVTIQVLVSSFSVSVYQAFNRWYWDKNYSERRNSIFFTSLMFVILASSVMMILLVVFSNALSGLLMESTKHGYLIQIMGLSAAFQIIARIPLSLMLLERKASLFSISNILKLIISLFFTIYFIVYLDKNVEAIFEAQVIGFIAFFIFTGKFIYRRIKIRIEAQILKEMLIYSYPLMFSSVAGILLTVVDRYTIRFIGNLNEVGIYSLGFKIANVLKILIINSLLNALNPYKFRIMDQPDRKRFYSKSLTYSLFIFVLFLMGISFFGKELVMLLARKEEYWTAYHIIPILCFAQLFELLRRSVIFGLVLKKKSKIISVITVFVSGMNIMVNIFFIYLWGSIGAAIATLVAQILFFYLIDDYAQKYSYIPYEYKKVYKIIAVITILTVAAYLLNPISLSLRLIFKALLFISFPFILYLLKFYEPVELKTIKQSFHKWKNPGKWPENIKNL